MSAPFARRRGLALAVLLAFLGAVALVSLRVVDALATPPDRLEQKLISAERYLYYRLSAEEGPRFELEGDERTLRLVSHALVPPSPYDPTRELVYGLRLEVVAGGQPLWTHDLYARSRQSKARRVPDHGGLWLDENAFSLEPGVEVTDDRQMVVQLPADLPTGAELRLRLCGEPAEAVVRVYAEVERSPRRRALRLRRLSPAGREAIADLVSYVPWDRLSGAEQVARLRFAEHRLPAAGKEGVDYATRVIYASGFRLALAEDAPARGLLVSPARAAAVNVLGPAQLTLELMRPTAATDDPGAQTLALRLRGEGAQPAPYTVDVPGGGRNVLHPIALGPGLHTLELSTSAALGVRVEITTADGTPVVPDEQLLPGYLSAPDGPPVLIAASGPDDTLGRALRIDVRLLAGATPAGAPLEGTLTLETLDPAGAVIARDSARIASVRAPFEALLQHGPGSEPVSEPVSLRFVVPRGGYQLRLRTSRPGFLRVSAPLALSPAADQLDAPYRDVPLATHAWRYPGYATHNWQPLRAHNHAELAPERTAKLATQARLEPLDLPEPVVAAAAQALAPEGQPERQTVLERVQPEDAARVRADWNPGAYTRVPPAQPVRLDFARAATPRRARVQYWVTGDADAVLGADVELVVDGEVVGHERFVTTHGSWKLPRGLTGVHTLTVRTRAQAVRLLVDRPPAAAGAELYALRTIHALDRPLRVRVEKGAGTQHLNVVVYGSDADADTDARIRVLVDGGAPRRVEGVALANWTLAERSFSLPAADRDPTLGFANVATRGRLHPRLLVVSLGDDLPPGTHTIELRTSGAAARWARFFVLSDRPQTREQAIQWRTSDEGDSE